MHFKQSHKAHINIKFQYLYHNSLHDSGFLCTSRLILMFRASQRSIAKYEKRTQNEYHSISLCYTESSTGIPSTKICSQPNSSVGQMAA